MVALISLLVIVTVSIIVVRIGAVALAMTGISKDLATFQAQSAFSGVGFTTNESESVVRHPVRRRIIRGLMLMGNAGITSAIAGLILTFYRGTGQELAMRLGLVLGGLVLLWLLSMSRFVDRILTKLIKVALNKFTRLEVRDYARLLEVGKGFTVSELEVEDADWLCNSKLHELALTNEGILVLGITRKDGVYIGAPHGNTLVQCGDVLTCYGREKLLRTLATRSAGRKGNSEHTAATKEQAKIVKEESKK
jgi:hypothetical protein